MTSWTSGYVTDLPYVSHFVRETAPVTLYLAALLRGVRPPSITSPIGIANSPADKASNDAACRNQPLGQFHGYDFAPAQIRNAESLLVETSLQNCVVGEESFASLCEKRPDELPSFDFIAVHGTYTWVDAERQREIVRFVAQRLKPGGLFYVSWNCMPGWAPMLAAQRVMVEHAHHNPGRIRAKLDDGLAFLDRFRERGAKMFPANPELEKRLEAIKTMDRTYLVHEFMHETWQPLYVTDVMRQLGEAKLDFVGSAYFGEMYDELVVTPELLEILNATPNVGMRELLRDMAINLQFRRDVFVRGATPLPALEQRQLLGELGIALTIPAGTVTLAARLLLGDVDLPPDMYMPIVEALMSGAKTVDQLADLPALANQPFSAVLQAAIILAHSGQVMLVPPGRKQDPSTAAIDASRSLKPRTVDAYALRRRTGVPRGGPPPARRSEPA